ncbi:type IV toxin-antitoxin system AbiEi family antitoxin domain-containing protein [Lamprocystis purpurea]|uniref:type IV toxin-antitoxin system AbiEi family antitoxin domain-containing protein n=1 Tax=Lamprocystis purpurea TaxID=61598 RepID=UPI0003A23487|nr:hypothetical protein [Lamprocystis purpurea]
MSEHSTLAEVARKHPRAVVCLLSALRFHELTTQAPFAIWLAIPTGPDRVRAICSPSPIRVTVDRHPTSLPDGLGGAQRPRLAGDAPILPIFTMAANLKT